MNLSLSITGVPEVQKMLDGLGKNAPAATRLWANWVGLEAQGAMRQALPTRFHLRGTKDGFEKAVVFTSAKTRGTRDIQAALHIGGPGFGASRTQKLGVILARHEAESTRANNAQIFFDGRGRAMTGLGFYVPAKGLRPDSTNPPRKLYPSAIGAALRKTPDSKLILAKGTKKGTKKNAGVSYFATRKGIFRRLHSMFGGRVEVDALWYFSNRVRTPARLGLWTTAQRIFEARAVALGRQAVEETLFRATL